MKSKATTELLSAIHRENRLAGGLSESELVEATHAYPSLVKSTDLEGNVQAGEKRVRAFYRGKTIFSRAVFRSEDQLEIIQEAIYAIKRACQEYAEHGDGSLTEEEAE